MLDTNKILLTKQISKLKYIAVFFLLGVFLNDDQKLYRKFGDHIGIGIHSSNKDEDTRYWLEQWDDWSC